MDTINTLNFQKYKFYLLINIKMSHYEMLKLGKFYIEY